MSHQVLFVIFLSTVYPAFARRDMVTIVQNTGRECFETRRGINYAVVHLGNIELGSVITN